MSCVIGDWLGITSVTWPAFAFALLNVKASAPVGSAGMLSWPFCSTAGLLLVLG